MKNKLVFRILGALSSALIIVSVFVPFVSVTGYSQSLWQTYDVSKALYLPIMIIVFGVIGVLVFATNIKTELAYASSGALLFFLLTQTIPVIQADTLNTLGTGYYFLVIGTVLTGIMAFLCNLRIKSKKITEPITQSSSQVSVIDQINKLYDNQTPIVNVQNNVSQPSQDLMQNNVSQMPGMSIEPVQPIQPIAPIEPIASSQIIEQPTAMNQMPEVVAPVENVSMQTNNTPIPEISDSISMTTVAQNNPVISEFSQPNINQQVVDNNQGINIPEINFSQGSVNPVVSEFESSAPQMTSEPIMPQEQPIPQPLNNVNQVNNSSNLDIFG